MRAGRGKISIKCNARKSVRNAVSQIGYLQIPELRITTHHHKTKYNSPSNPNPSSPCTFTSSKFKMENIGINNSQSLIDESHPLMDPATSQPLLQVTITPHLTKC